MPARVSMIALTVALAGLASAAANPRPIGHAAYTTPAAPVYGKPEDSPEYTAPKYTTPGAGKPAYPVGTGVPGCYGDECGEDADYTKVISSTYVATLTTTVPCEPYVTGTETRSYTEKEIRSTATNYQTITHHKGDYAPTGYPYGGKGPYGGKPYGGKGRYGGKPYGKKPYGGKDPKYTNVAKPKTTVVYKNAYTTVYEDVYEDVPTATGVPHKGYPASDYEDSVEYPTGHGKPVPTPVSPKETVYVTVPAKTVTVTESAYCGEATPVTPGHGYVTPSGVSPKPTGSYGTPGKPVEKPKEETGKPAYGTPAKPTGHGYATPSAVTPKPTGSYGSPVEKPTEEHDEYEAEDPSKSSPKPTGSYGSPAEKPTEEHDEYEVEDPSKSSPKPTGSYGSPVEKPEEHDDEYEVEKPSPKPTGSYGSPVEKPVEEEEDCTSTDAAAPTGTYVAPTGSYATPVKEKPVEKPVYAAPSASATPVKTY